MDHIFIAVQPCCSSNVMFSSQWLALSASLKIDLGEMDRIMDPIIHYAVLPCCCTAEHAFDPAYIRAEVKGRREAETRDTRQSRSTTDLAKVRKIAK